MPMKLTAAKHLATASSISHGGEEYTVTDGCISVPDGAVPALREHGWRTEADLRAAPLGDDEPITDADLPHASDQMSKSELIAYLLGHGIAIPRPSTVGSLRAMVREALDAPPAADEPAPAPEPLLPLRTGRKVV